MRVYWQRTSLLTGGLAGGEEYAILAGTVGRSKQLFAVVSSGALDIKDLKGKWESFVITTVDNPKNTGERLLVVAGLDPGIVFYKIIIDDGGYEPTFLKKTESPFQKQ